MSVEDKYLKYEITTRKAGLRHQTYNLKTLFYESFILKRTPVVTKWHLFGYHNFNKGFDSNFTRYFDFSKVKIGSHYIKGLLPEELPDNMNEQSVFMDEPIDHEVQMVIRRFPPIEGCSWKYLQTDFDIYHDVQIPYSQEVKNHAESLLAEIGRPFTAVHVRRRDVLKKKWRLLLDTRAGNIISVLDKTGSPNNVYIMSNEPKSNFFDKIRKSYNLLTIWDVPWLMKIQAEDNFMAYCIENQLLKMADTKITTFSDNTDEDWDAHLSKAKW